MAIIILWFVSVCIALWFVFVAFQCFCFFRCFPLIVDVFPSVLVCNPDLFSLNRFMTFEQRYTTVALFTDEL